MKKYVWSFSTSCKVLTERSTVFSVLSSAYWFKPSNSSNHYTLQPNGTAATKMLSKRNEGFERKVEWTNWCQLSKFKLEQ